MTDEKRIAQADSLCYLVKVYCSDEHNEFFNSAVVVDAMDVVHDLLTFGENLE